MENNDNIKITHNPPKLRQQFERGLTAFLVIALSLIFYFIILRWNSIFAVLAKIFKLLAPVWFGCAFAYIDNPLMKLVERHFYAFLEKRGAKDIRKMKSASRGVGIFVAIAVAILIVGLLLGLVIPEVLKSIRRLVIILPKQMNDLVSYMEQFKAAGTQLGQMGTSLLEKLNTTFQDWLNGDLWNNVNNLLDKATSGIVNFIGMIFNMMIGVIIAVYILYSKERFSSQSKKMLYSIAKPERANFLLELTFKANDIFTGFLVGKLIDSLIIGVLCYILMVIFHISESYTLLVSVIVGVTNIIPFFGPFIGAIPSAFLILLENPLHGVYFIILIICLQQFDGNILGPKILGNSTGLSAFWVVVSILLGGGLFGFVGMILGVPTFAVLYYIIKMSVANRLKKRNLPSETADYNSISGYDIKNKTFTHFTTEQKKVQQWQFHRKADKNKKES